MEILVTGATGFVGRHVADELARSGRRVRCLVRPSADASELERAGYGIVRGEVLDQGSLDAAVRGADAVVHVAGLIAARSFREMRRVNEEGVGRLAAACSRAPAPPRRFVLISSLAAAGPSRRGRPVREEDPPRPVSRYGLTKLLGERAAARTLPASIPLTVIRPPAVYGPFDRGILGFFDAAARGVLLRVGTRPRRVSIVHGEDLAAGVRLALDADRAAGRTYFVADPASHAIDDLISRIAAAVGGRTRRVRLPEPVVRAAGVLAEEVARWRGATPLFSRDKAREFLAEGWVCDPRRAMDELGWRPARTLDEGLAATVRWYRERGWIPSPRMVR
jgi:nucleoside-diphosphate-sugar epimerase